MKRPIFMVLPDLMRQRSVGISILKNSARLTSAVRRRTGLPARARAHAAAKPPYPGHGRRFRREGHTPVRRAARE